MSAPNDPIPAPLPPELPDTVCFVADTIPVFPASEPAAPSQAAPSPILRAIGDYEILSKLGQGGMGTVYRARQISLGRLVALKILPAEWEGDEDFIGRFRREARLAASLNHPNLVSVFSSGAADGRHYIAMELIEGETLAQRLKRGALPPLEALRICLAVAHALQCGWQSGQLIHRDVKPSNIYLAHSGEVKLGDLGLAKSLLSNTTVLTDTGAAMGTPHYTSPEQARGEKALDFRADIYSLGCTLFQSLTGRTPYEGSDPLTIMNLHLNGPPPAILKVLPQCPIPLARLVARTLKKSRHERFGSYEELIAALVNVQAFLEMKPGAAANTLPPDLDAALSPPPGPSPPPPKSKVPLYGGIAAGILLLGVVAFVFWPGQEKLSEAEIAEARREAEERARAEQQKGTTLAATRETPFENTLGMKFVPVPITGGPSGGQRVLFSVWETRVQDYDAFARETKRAWPKLDFPQEAAHPAVNVKWEDAKAFCTWLTERERNAGKLGVKERYRLPSDHEWSCAVGIGAREDAAKTPADKNQQIPEIFPWGRAWPPPAGAGNYGGEEIRAEVEEGTQDIASFIAGYTDGATRTLPVGSFAANALGLYDLGGNAWEWCEDWFDGRQEERVMRGGSWANGDRAGLRSSRRGHNTPVACLNRYGFRPVLTAAPADAAAGNREAVGRTGSAAIKLWDTPEKVKAKPGVEWKNGVLALGVGGEWGTVTFAEPKSLNAIIRASIRMNPDAESSQIGLRNRASGTKHSRYTLGIRPDKQEVFLFTVTDDEARVLRTWPLPRTYGADEWARLELRASGDELTATLDGKVLGTIHDPSQSEPGEVIAFARANGRFRDIEYVPLDQTAASLEPAAIKLWDAPDKLPKKPGFRWENGAVIIDAASLKHSTPLSRDAILRAEIRMNPDADGAQLGLRHRAPEPGANFDYYRLAVSHRSGGVHVVLFAVHLEKTTALQSWPLPRAYGPDEWLRLELRAIGDELTAVADGQTLGTVHDSSLPDAGSAMLFAVANGNFRKIVYVPLDKSGAPPSAPEPSEIKLWDTPEKIPKLPGIRWENGVVRIDGAAARYSTTISRDAIIRAEMRMNPGKETRQIGLRHRLGEADYYRVQVSPDASTIILDSVHPGKTTELRRWRLPRTYGPDEWLRVELRAIADELTVSADGEVLGSVHDTSLPKPGGVQLFAVANGQFRNIVYVPLDEPAAIKLWDAPEKITASGKNVRWEKNAVRLDGQPLKEKVPARDLVFRTTILLNPDAGGPQMHVRVRHGALKSSYYSFGISPDLKLLVVGATIEGEGRAIKTWPMPRTPGPDQWVRLELRVVGDDITASADGKILGTVRDSSVPDAGDVVLFAKAAGYFRDTEYLPLDKRGTDATAADIRAAALAANPANWVDRLTSRKWEAPWTLEKGVLKTTDKDKAISGTLATLQDGAIRVRARSSGSSGRQLQLILRSGAVPGVKNTAGLYHLQVNGNGTVCTLIYAERRDGDAKTETRERLWRDAPLPAAPAGQTELELEFRAVGDVLSAWANGQFVASAHHARVPRGTTSFYSDLALEITKAETIDFASGTASAAPPPAAVTYPQPPKWIDATATLRSVHLANGSLLAEGEWLKAAANKTFDLVPGLQSRNPIVRVLFSDRADIRLRRTLTQTDDAFYGAFIRREIVGINFSAKSTRQIAGQYLTERLEGEHEAVFAAQGEGLSLWLDGRKITSGPDRALASGGIALALTKGDPKGDSRIKKVEYGELPDAAPVVAAGKAGAAPAAWVPVTLSQAWVARQIGASLNAEGELTTGSNFSLPEIAARDIALRAEVRLPPETSSNGIILRRVDRLNFRQLAIYSRMARLQIPKPDGKYPTLSLLDYPPEMDIAGKWVPVEFATVGKMSLGTVQSLPFIPGISEEGLQPGQVNFNNLEIRKIEVMILDDVPEAQWPEFIRAGMKLAAPGAASAPQAVPAARNADAPSVSTTATKDAPFVNSLGMKFVPVPITGGPTDKQRVLFSVWETRVQDYEVFAKETVREWPKVNFPQGPTHPAVSVTWDDAQAFCAWLTDRESKAGQIGANERYRLPSDHEWSCAIGIGEREDPAKRPPQKQMSSPDVFPWGTVWPPPPGAGNYSGEETADHPQRKDQKILTGYHDEFPMTAPVASFAANRAGLFDLGGNIREWCEDWFDAEQQFRTLRGASFTYAERADLWSSFRSPGRPVSRNGDLGFRVVLAAGVAPR